MGVKARATWAQTGGRAQDGQRLPPAPEGCQTTAPLSSSMIFILSHPCSSLTTRL